MLDRPQVRNAIDLGLVGELHDLCALLEAVPRPLILTGAGGAFAGGADIAQLRDRTRDDALAGINSRLFERVARLPQPTIAVVNGAAIGGGAELAYACDIRLASPTASFSSPEPELGIAAAAGASWRLAELIGMSVAKQVLLAGYRLDADAALRHGLVAEVLPEEDAVDRAHALVDGILARAPLAVRLTKLIVDAREVHPLADDLTQAILFETDDKRERMSAFLDRTRR